MFLRKIKNALSNIGGSGSSMEMLYYRLKYGLASFLGFIWSEEHYAKWFWMFTVF